MGMRTDQVAMRDGTVLATDVHLPEGDGPWPVLIARTPYRRGQFRGLGPVIAGSGVAFLVQDVRGTGDSGGAFRFYAQEPDDALDTARWLLAQPWCDGRLAILGLSYLAGASIAIAAEMPERVRGCIWVTLPISRDLLAWEGGAMRLHHTLPWTVLTEGRSLAGFDWGEVYRTLPLAGAAPGGPLWQQIVANEEPDGPLWRSLDLSHYLDRVRVPGLHFGGWYDFVLDATLVPYRRMAAASGAAQRLVIGPWSHNQIVSAALFWEETAAFLRHSFGGEPYERAPVRAFLTAPGTGGRWVSLERWPDEGGLAFYPAAGGRLVSEPEPGDGAADTFVYDPLDPVPTQGGAVWEFPQSRVGLEPGPLVQTTAARPDVLVYETEPLERGLSVCGPVAVELWAASSATDTDFTAKLCDVAPDGTATWVCDGIIRARYRRRLDAPAPLEPGVPDRFRIAMACGHTFPPGHRVRLEIGSSNFPKYNRNLNHGGSLLHSGPEAAVTATQTVYRSRTRLLLPVLPEG